MTRITKDLLKAAKTPLVSDSLLLDALSSFWKEVAKHPPLPDGKYYAPGEPDYVMGEDGIRVNFPVVIREDRHKEPPADKDPRLDAIKRVLQQRRDCLKLIKTDRLPDESKGYYEGKADGYEQAIALLGESLESILVEL